MTPRRWIRDDLAYLLPMGVFLLFTQAGRSWPALYPASYIVKTVVVACLLVWLWPRYTPIRWNHWYLGAALGVVGVVQWVFMQHWLERHFTILPILPFLPDKIFNSEILTTILRDVDAIFRPDPDTIFDPTNHFAAPAARWAFIGIRLAGASLLVPVMEELFWRDFAWRTIAAPYDFKLVKVGEWDLRAFVIVPLIFATVHGNWCLTAVVWAFMIGGLLVWTRSLGACIIMHGVTNLLLGLYVLHTHEWALW